MNGMAWLRLAIWIPLLFGVHRPWRSLGGLVPERLRWFETASLLMLFPIGWVVGAFAGDPQPDDQRRRWFRWGLLLPMLVWCVGVAGFEAADRPEVGLAVFGAGLAYVAGFDVGAARSTLRVAPETAVSPSRSISTQRSLSWPRMLPRSTRPVQTRSSRRRWRIP